MEFMQLQMFVAAAEERSLQKAAERVHRTPQAVSMAIGKLEDEIGAALFERSASRGLRLTASGEVLLDYARRALALLNEAVAQVEAIRKVKGGQLRIGANQSIGEYLLPQLGHAFQAQYPNVRLRIVIGYSEAMLAALRRRDVDLALVADRPNDPELQSELLMKDRLIALVNPQHRFAQEPSIPLEALAGEALILLTETSELRERIMGTFRRFGVPLVPAVETGTLESIKRMVARNMGIGIVPLLCVRNEQAGQLLVKSIGQFETDRSLWIVYPQTPSPAARAFVALVGQEVGKEAAAEAS
jgi:DNA-binding transcriptional LysR family regulator